MSEEVKDQEVNEAPEEKKEEQGASEESSATAESKVKKINRLTLAQLNAKISEMETKNLTQSVYYKHLMERKRELEVS